MTQIAAALFAWDAVEARSDLERFFLVRDHLPDSDLIAALEAKRGLGRDDYPVIPRSVTGFATPSLTFCKLLGSSNILILVANPDQPWLKTKTGALSTRFFLDYLTPDSLHPTHSIEKSRIMPRSSYSRLWQ